jgi:hypothetical protein
MNLHGGLTGRLKAHVAPAQAEDYVMRSLPAPLEKALFVGLCDVLGRRDAVEVRAHYPADRDATVYTLRHASATLTGLDAVRAISQYDLGRLIGERLRAAMQ